MSSDSESDFDGLSSLSDLTLADGIKLNQDDIKLLAKEMVKVIVNDEKLSKALRGKRGRRGKRGKTGDRGERGVRGDRGDRGQKGEKGDTGEKGETGKRGEKGEKGEKGTNAIPNAQTRSRPGFRYHQSDPGKGRFKWN